MNTVYFFKDMGKLPTALGFLGIKTFQGKKVPIKLHMGEPGNKYYISPSLVKLTVESLQAIGATPFLFDTTVAYPGPRSTKEGYQKAARQHGFGYEKMGCEAVIGDTGVKVAQSGHSFEVATQLYESTHMIVMSHVKGHIQAGFGGAIKNLGMGGVTKASKSMIHHMSIPTLAEESCQLCGACAEVCPSQAIEVDVKWKYDSIACEGCGKCVDACPNEALSYEVMDLQKGLALSAQACVKSKQVIYISALVNIAGNCDCDSHPGPIICPDIGYLASGGLAAIDKASLDLVDNVKPGIFKEVNQIDPVKQIQYLEQETGASAAYELIKL
ncbi:MAG: DUF362 domain-containing protein [Dehalococcoidales bacterium]|nr:DUF362 domain-containing protein [Dehalococcoidales bacterium]